ncbi:MULTISPECIES: hypothetical protein [unclassified Sphingobacterium]|uniref:hypothetical protein n=1 Tax=unclassified Sphingobacterium TaxID=2609468 RepID=UPI0025FCE3BF|nr:MULTISPECIES: hypothetical protein [unclassified Sphingobacterium]
MKNSVWYHKLWREKLNKTEIKESPDAAWEGMKNTLDQYLPLDVPVAATSAVSVGAKIWKLIGYILPAVAVVSTVAYIYLPDKKEDKSRAVKTKEMYADSLVSSVQSEDERANTETDSSTNADLSRIPDYRISHDDLGSKLSTPAPLKRSFKERHSNVPEEYNNSEYVTTPFSPGDRIVHTDNNMLFNYPQARVLYNSKIEGASVKSLSDIKPGLGFNRQKRPQSALVAEYSYTDKERKRRGAEKNRKNNIYYKSSGRNKQVKFTTPGSVWNPSYNFGLETGANIGTQGTNLYAGVFGQIAFNHKWAVSLGLNANSNRKVSGEFSHPSYFRPDSLGYSFMIRDSRKLAAIDIPLKVEYRLSNHISLNTGVIIDLPVKQSSKMTGLGPVYDVRDTLRHSQEINSALTNINANKVNIGLSGGITVHLQRFDLKGNYQVLNPYRVSNALGSYKPNNGFYRVGIGYRFK